MIPSVPSAPMNSLSVSNPAEHFRERRRVLMTSPEGKTIVCIDTCEKNRLVKKAS